MFSKVVIFAIAVILAAPICAAPGGSSSGGGSSAGAGAGGQGGGGGGGGHGGGGAAHGGAGQGGSAAHGGAGHAIGIHIPSIGLGTREGNLAKMGFVDAYKARIDGHDATVAVFHRAPLTAAERDHLYHYHFKGFNDCVVHEACAGRVKEGGEMYCRRARNVAITSDLECLSFRPSE
jgi:hypothetical protein